MKCPGCGSESPALSETCNHCGLLLVAIEATLRPAPTASLEDLLSLRYEPESSAPGPGVPGRRRQRKAQGTRAVRGGDFVETPDHDAIEVGEDDLDGALLTSPGFVEDDDGPLFRIDDDLFAGYDPGTSGVLGTAAGTVDLARHHDDWSALGADQSGTAFILADAEHDSPCEVEPIIECDNEVPERYWAPEVAGLGRRALALLVDQVLLLAILGLFCLGALLALRINNLTTGLFLSAAGLQASALPFALLAALLSLAFSIFFHGSTGRTPGKALAGIEVRTGAGGAITWGRAILRWFGAALGLVCAGVGIFWAVFEPRRRGWADLISGTVVARLQREPASEVSRL